MIKIVSSPIFIGFLTKFKTFANEGYYPLTLFCRKIKKRFNYAWNFFDEAFFKSFIQS